MTTNEIEVISQKEIADSLINSTPSSRRKISIYDFSRPKDLSRKDINTIKDRFTQFSLRLKHMIGLENNIQLMSIDQLTYKEALSIFPFRPIHQTYRNKHLGEVLIEKSDELEDLLFSAIEDSLQKVIGKIKPIVTKELAFRFEKDQSEMMMLLSFEATIIDASETERSNNFHILISSKRLREWLSPKEKAKKDKRMFDRNKIKTTIDARLGKAVYTLGELDLLRDGSLIELDRKLGDLVPIYVDGVLAGEGEVVAIDDRFAVRVSKLFEVK